MKNKWLIAIIVILVIALGLIGIYLINNKEKANEDEKIYENVKIISDDFSNGTPIKIIYNDKEYLISEKDELYSIKFYNGKIYYYKNIEKIANYFQEDLEIADMNSIFYEFGEIILNEEDLTYTMKLIKKISYTEYEKGNKENIEYCIGNSGEYGLEMVDENLIDEIDNITIMSGWKNDRYYITYTKRNDKNEIIWKYQTEKETYPAGQYTTVNHIDIKNEKIYINENGTIVALNMDNGKVAFKYKYADPDGMGIPATIDYFDEEGNAFISYYDKITILDKDGKVKATIENEFLGHFEGGNIIEKIDNNTYLAVGTGAVVISIKDYTIKEAIGNQEIEDESGKDTWAWVKKDGKGKVIWTYKTDGWLLNDEWLKNIKQERLYLFKEGKVTALSTENGKVLWENSDYKGDENDSNPVCCLDSKGNIYLAQKYSPKLLIIDKNGKTLQRLDRYQFTNNFTTVNYEYYGGLDIELSNNESELIISGDVMDIGKAKVIINLNDYSAKLLKVNE